MVKGPPPSALATSILLHLMTVSGRNSGSPSSEHMLPAAFAQLPAFPDDGDRTSEGPAVATSVTMAPVAEVIRKPTSTITRSARIGFPFNFFDPSLPSR